MKTAHMTAEDKIEKLKAALPEWIFKRYSTNPACQTVACFPPRSTNYEAWHQLAAHAHIGGVCGPLYTVDHLTA